MDEHIEGSTRAESNTARLCDILNAAEVIVYSKDLAGRYTWVNRKGLSITGRSLEQTLGRTDAELVPRELSERFGDSDDKILSGEAERVAVETTMTLPDGTRRVFENISRPLKDSNGRIVGVVGTSSDITELYEAREKLRQLSLTDHLTSLGNRRNFDEHVARELNRAQRQGTPTALLLMDLDHFKSVNDRFGHPVGDDVLVRIARIVREHTRTEDVSARMGGEEFGIVMPDTDLEQALAVAQRLHRHINETNHLSNGLSRFKVSASFGLATCDSGGMSLREFYILADQALLEAKQRGRNCIVSV